MVRALPAARTPDPRNAPGLRWGVLGTGWIADKFVTALQKHSTQRIAAVGSRSLDSAGEFAQRLGVERAYGSYEELVSDPGVDVVYVATPHNAHVSHALLALEAGKHTLVEKPLALNADQGQRIADAARSRGLFCMEAYWTAFLPKYDVLRQLIGTELVGEITAVVADFGEWFSPAHRIHRPELAGGPMLDLGTYLISFVLDAVGPPDRIVAWGTKTETGVMGQTAMLLSRRDQQAVLHTTILANTPTTATIAGTAATIDIDGPFYQPGGFTLTGTDGATRLRYDEPRIGHEGFALPGGRSRQTHHGGRDRFAAETAHGQHRRSPGDGRGPATDRRSLSRRRRIPQLVVETERTEPTRAAIFSGERPCLSSMKSLPADSPQVSSTPIRSIWGAGPAAVKISATKPPSPPYTECSSTVTTRSAPLTASTRADSSMGLMDGTWITEASIPDSARRSAAASTRPVCGPVEMRLTRPPARSRWIAPGVKT